MTAPSFIVHVADGAKGHNPMSDRSGSIIILFFLVLVVGYCFLMTRPPAPVPASAPADQFSAARAFRYLQEFAQVPHPIGSPEHDRVRDYLLAQIAQLGLTPEVQRTTGVTPRFQAAGVVENVATRLKGASGSTSAVVLVAHYDSVAAGPGAGDDGAGVAALLEVARDLRSGPTLRNDIVFLFTDGEEAGLLGAAAFVAEHPWFKDARVVVNFEARGNAGESQLFETSPGNGHLVELFANAAPHRAGSSLTYEIYKHMPNDTDMTLFKKAGIAGLNFAFIGHWEAYHSPLDNPQQLDLSSLQQHGENALSLARSLGNADLSKLQDRDAVFFSLPGGLFIHYSTRFVWPLAILGAVAFMVVSFYANSRFKVRWTRPLLALLAWLIVVLVSAVTAAALAKAISWLHLHWLPEGNTVQNAPYLLCLFGILLALHASLWKWLRRKFHSSALCLGGALLTLLFVLAVSAWLPGGSYVFAWPLLAILLATSTVAFRPHKLSAAALAGLCILSLPVLLIFVPLLKGFYLALGFTAMGGPVLGAMFVLLLILLSPLLDALLERTGRWVPLVALLFAIGFFILGAATAPYSDAHPKPSLMAYALDADSGKAQWASSAARLDSWTSQIVGNSPTRGRLPGFFPDWFAIEFFLSSAPALPLLPPQAELVDTSVNDDIRTLHLRISSPRRAPVISISAPDAKIIDSKINGHSLGSPAEARWNSGQKWAVDFSNASSGGSDGTGIEIELRVQGTGPLKLVLVDRSSGVSAVPGKNVPPRPPDSMPVHWGAITMVRRSFTF